MRLQTCLCSGIVLGAAALLLAPGESAVAFSKIGGSLGLGQRDVRVYDNFLDAATNNNVTPDAQFPGQLGSEMAIWKGVVEWGSGPHGTGTGDPTQAKLGDGGANFDAVWVGKATAVGGKDQNVVSAISSCSGGTLAYTETPIQDGWRIRVCDNWTWADGPSTISGGQFDLQGVACHEYGHALGLGHSTIGSATMYPSVSSGSVAIRSLDADDSAGVKSIYGTKLSTKPVISSASVAGSNVTINGVGFDLASNEVWFTRRSATNPGIAEPRVIVTGVPSSGTSLTVAAPVEAGDGDVLVRIPGSGGDKLSNAFPIDIP
jgi:hypothetical protein